MLEGQDILRLPVAYGAPVELGKVVLHLPNHIQIPEQVGMQGLGDLFHQEEAIGAVVGRAHASEVHVDVPVLHGTDGRPGGVLRDQLDVVHPAHEDIGWIPLHDLYNH